MCASTSPASIARHLRRFARCERGAVMPLFLVSAAVILGASLGGIDLARHASATTRLQNALDGAALAMGRLAASEQDEVILLKEAKRYFEANFPKGYQGSGIDASTLSLSVNDSGRVLTLSTDGSLPLLSTGFLDVSAAPLRATSTVALEGNSNLEVVFAVDTSATSDIPNSFANSLKGLATDLLERGQGSTHIGIVPYSEVVNVGTEHQQWVARWRDHAPNEKKNAEVLKDYLSTKWTGCIAEPSPWQWNASGIERVKPLTPDANFMPVIARIETGLWQHKKKNNKDWPQDMGDGWVLEGVSNPYNVYKGGDPAYPQPHSVTELGSSDRPSRLLWVDFDKHHGGGSPHQNFNLYSIHEPENCHAETKVHFLDNDPGSVPDRLKTLTMLTTVSQPTRVLPPAGLLWSWRMLNPAWREAGNGWSGSPYIQAENGQEPAQAIVIVTQGDIGNWNTLQDASNTHRVWRNGSSFKFELSYYIQHSNGKGQPSLRTHAHNHELAITNNGWQRPVSSLAMKDPFASTDHIVFSGKWPSVAEYTSDTCAAIQGDNIQIFVLSPKAVISNQTLFKNCASDSQVYTNTDALREALLNLRSESSTLRLVPSRNS